jgi:hypothetical protein
MSCLDLIEPADLIRTEVSLFVRDRATDRLVFNPKAIEALGLSPTELGAARVPAGW